MTTLTARSEIPFQCRSRRKEAQTSMFFEGFSFSQSLLTSAPTIFGHALGFTFFLLLALVSQLASQAADAPARPNIIFILVDDLRWDALGCMGHPFVKTPNIDRIAKEGAIFKNTFVTTPLGSPARASFLTGTYVRTHHVKGNGDNAELSHKLVTFQKLLHDAGYETSHIGKW